MENKPNKFQRETADSFKSAYEKKPQADCSWFSPTPIIHLKVMGHVPKSRQIRYFDPMPRISNNNKT